MQSELEYGTVLHSKELQSIIKKGNFKSGKASIRLHTIMNLWERCLYAIDYGNEYIYLLFVFNYFSLIIHDRVDAESPLQRTMVARSTAEKYKSILQQFISSGL